MYETQTAEGVNALKVDLNQESKKGWVARGIPAEEPGKFCQEIHIVGYL